MIYLIFIISYNIVLNSPHKIGGIFMKTKLKRITLLTLVTILCFSIIGCTRPDDKTNHIDIRGIVTQITIDSEEGSILVEGKVEDDTEYDKASIRVTRDTIIQNDSLSKSYKLSDIQIADKVEVAFKGPVAESYPVQASADIIRIITSKQ
jgi:hypothetical protein